MTTTDFASLGLPENLVRTLTAAGFTTPTPIQQQSIPAQLAGQDILGLAQTGSGKTAAFGLPLVAQLLTNQPPRVAKCAGALILAPTRELAVQIDDMIRTYARNTGLTTCLVLGGLSRQGQINKLARGIDIVIATPGRLADLMDAKKVRLDQTHYLILDEADRMLDMGFVKQVKQIAAATAKDRRTALFSATMAPEVAKLTQSLLNNPLRVEAAAQGTPVAEIEQQVVAVPTKMKRSHLNTILADESVSKVILFSRTKHGADKVAKNLGIDGHTVAAIHGNKSQGARQSALRSFRDGRVRVLVATDIAARGIDVPHISHVINYDLPDEAENYVHRIGRTGRNGAGGIAISMIDHSERSKLRDIERLIRRKLPLGDMPEGYAAQAAAMPREPSRGPKPANRNGNRPNRSGKPANSRFAKDGQRPARDGERPVRDGQRPARDGERSARDGQRPARDGQRPARDGQRPARDGQRPARDDQRAARDDRRPAAVENKSNWTAKTEEGGATGNKPQRNKKPRWSSKQKSIAKVARTQAQRYGDGASAA